jgi:hypothetical protein
VQIRNSEVEPVRGLMRNGAEQSECSSSENPVICSRIVLSNLDFFTANCARLGGHVRVAVNISMI